MDQDNYSNDAQIRKAYNNALRLLSFRARSKKEIEDRLNKKGYGQKIILIIIQKLTEQNLLDDAGFAAAWIEQRQKKGKGKLIIKKELQDKGIEKQIIDNLLANSQDDPETAFLFLKSKYKKFAKTKTKEPFKKIVDFLARRGFTYENIKTVIKRLEENK